MLGCVSSYITCSSKIGYIMSCPEGLVLDLDSQECLRKEQIAICNNAASASSASMPYGLSAPMPYGTNADYSNAIATQGLILY